MVREKSGNCTPPPPPHSAQAHAGDWHMPTPPASACSCHTTGTTAGESTRSTAPSPNTACSWGGSSVSSHGGAYGCPFLQTPAPQHPVPQPAHPSVRQCSLPASAGPHKRCLVWVLVAKTSSSPCCCARGGAGGEARLQPPAQMYPGITFTAGLAPNSAMVFGGT